MFQNLFCSVAIAYESQLYEGQHKYCVSGAIVHEFEEQKAWFGILREK